MKRSNVSRVHGYLETVAAMGPYEAVAQFYAPGVRVQEFPNRIVPQGRIRRGSELQAAYEQGKQILRSQSYRVQRIVECGDEVAVELEWRAVLAVALGHLAAGSEMKAFVAMFLKFRDGKMWSNEITIVMRRRRNDLVSSKCREANLDTPLENSPWQGRARA